MGHGPDLHDLTEEQLDRRLALLEARLALKRDHKLEMHKLYPAQWKFVELSKTKREIVFLAGNKCGKTMTGGYMMACHLTGLYPPEWTGRKYDHPVDVWIGGESGELTRDELQMWLLGDLPDGENVGTGFIPKHLIGRKLSGHGVGGLLDGLWVKHTSGGWSKVGFKTYGQGRGRWQAAFLDIIWVDEEPPDDVYEEAVARLKGDGFIFVTCTPLEGATSFIKRFTQPENPDAARVRGVAKMGLAQAEHFTEQEKQDRLAGYSGAKRRAREFGDPVLDKGSVWEDVNEEDLYCNIRLAQVPEHWVKLWGLDFGIGHPFAAVLIAWDKDADCIYVIDCFKMAGTIPMIHAARIKNIAPGVLCAWPKDGGDREKGTGRPLMELYRDEGLLMRPTFATHVAGGVSTETGVTEMHQRMRDGRLKVAAHLRDWFDEFGIYHRDDHGLIVKINDDLMSATRIAVMDRRFAQRAQVGSPIMGTGESRVRVLPGADEGPYWGM